MVQRGRKWARLGLARFTALYHGRHNNLSRLGFKTHSFIDSNLTDTKARSLLTLNPTSQTSKPTAYLHYGGTGGETGSR